VTINKFF
jgi:hypothetical protein